jgi:fucose permease
MFNLLLCLVYICFISLGLPDSLLGSAWPVMHVEISAPFAYAGIVSIVISVGTIISSFFCDRIVRWLGSGKLTAISIALTAIGLFGFSQSSAFWMLILWAIPYGLGAGAVDATLNNYVALHFKAQHMSWLHCFWGVGASISPYIMSFALIKLDSWSMGYLIVSIIQIILSVFIFMSLPLWKNKVEDTSDTERNASKPLSFGEILSIKGAVPCFLTFFSYCAFELTSSLWASSYLVQNRGIDEETASALASLFYIGLTFGRAVNGFLAMKLSDRFLIRMGASIVLCGVALLFIPTVPIFAIIGFIVIGLGCAPIYPCIIHMTPSVFGRDKSQAMIGIQMAFAYTGLCIMPPLFGFIAEHTSISLLPIYLLALLTLMAVMHETTVIKTKK